jgi:hypothetical protein
MNPRQNITYPNIKGDLQFEDNTKLFTAKSSFNGSIDIVFIKDYLIELAAPYNYKITKAFFKVSQGTCLLNVKRNDTVILPNVEVTDMRSFITEDINISEDDSILIEIISSTNAFGLNYAFHIEPYNE